jgi:hypothetical protein
MSGGVDYFSHCSSARPARPVLRRGGAAHEDGYLTDLITAARAVDFVGRMGGRAGKPFFLSLHYTAPHWPWETRDDAGAGRGQGQPVPPARRQHPHLPPHDPPHGRRHRPPGGGAARHGQLDNTLVVFTSDNGGERFSDNWPLVGGKMDLTEGGIRVPWIAHWPAVIAPGGVSAQHCLTMDWSATMLDVAGAPPDPDHPLDGVSLAAGAARRRRATFAARCTGA